MGVGWLDYFNVKFPSTNSICARKTLEIERNWDELYLNSRVLCMIGEHSVDRFITMGNKEI